MDKIAYLTQALRNEINGIEKTSAFTFRPVARAIAKGAKKGAKRFGELFTGSKAARLGAEAEEAAKSVSLYKTRNLPGVSPQDRLRRLAAAKQVKGVMDSAANIESLKHVGTVIGTGATGAGAAYGLTRKKKNK